jgi:peptide/nickel transport system permease protein
MTEPAPLGTPPSSTAPTDSLTLDASRPGSTDKIYTAKQWTLIRRAFFKHKLAVLGLCVTLAIYFIAIFAGFLAPFSASRFNADYVYAPPQRLHVVDRSHGGWDWGLYVSGYKSTQNRKTLALTYRTDPAKKIPVRLFAHGAKYKLFGLIPTHIHLIGPADPKQPMYLLGADRNGRDLLSRMIYATRISMSIGLVGVAIALGLGIALGGVSGYFGGKVDTLIQRLVEFFMSIPTLPLWLGLAAALPGGWGPLKRYFAITIILGIVAWTSLARVTRGRFLSLREEDFVSAAALDGNSHTRMIYRHMLPSMTSYLIAHMTLAIPGMILAETSLSFLGLGLQPPVVSWGVLLEDAQNVRVVSSAPWLLLPGVAVTIAVLALNFLGDGLRDAADPYRR